MGFFDSFVDEGKKRFGKDARPLVGLTEEENFFGFNIPFCLQYLLNSNIIPMGKIIGVAGPPESCKSLFGFELHSLCIAAGGAGHLIETENKVNTHLIGSVIGHQALKDGKLRIDQTISVEDAQRLLSHTMAYYKDQCPDKDMPFSVGVDSLGAPASEAMLKEIEEAGFASRTFPESALLWTFYLKKISVDIIGQPILVYFTNHLKDKMDDGGTKKGPFQEKPKSKQGGVAQDFHATYNLYFQRKSDIRQASREGALITIKAQKCGTGPSRRKIEAPVLWHFDHDEAGEPVQITKWDWNDATAKLLTSEELPRPVKDVSDISCKSNSYSSQKLGLRNVPGTELGAALHANAEYMDELQKAAGIRKWKAWPAP